MKCDLLIDLRNASIDYFNCNLFLIGFFKIQFCFLFIFVVFVVVFYDLSVVWSQHFRAEPLPACNLDSQKQS